MSTGATPRYPKPTCPLQREQGDFLGRWKGCGGKELLAAAVKNWILRGRGVNKAWQGCCHGSCHGNLSQVMSAGEAELIWVEELNHSSSGKEGGI